MKKKNTKKDNKKEVKEQKKWEIRLYKDINGKCPVEDFMESLSEIEKDKMIKRIGELKDIGYNITRPKGVHLRDKIYELRITLTNNETRTLFFFEFDNYIILTHTFIKKTQKVPNNEIEKAIKYKKDFLQRYNKENIKGEENA